MFILPLYNPISLVLSVEVKVTVLNLQVHCSISNSRTPLPWICLCVQLYYVNDGLLIFFFFFFFFLGGGGGLGDLKKFHFVTILMKLWIQGRFGAMLLQCYCKYKAFITTP